MTTLHCAGLRIVKKLYLLAISRRGETHEHACSHAQPRRTDRHRRRLVLHLRIRDLAQRAAHHLRQARLRSRRRQRLPGADGVLSVVLLPGVAVVVDPAPHRHEARHGARPVRDGRRRARVRTVRHHAHLSRRAHRTVRDRRRIVAAANGGESVRQHPRSDRRRRAAHRDHGHLQQARRHRCAVDSRRCRAQRHRRIRRSRHPGARRRARRAACRFRRKSAHAVHRDGGGSRVARDVDHAFVVARDSRIRSERIGERARERASSTSRICGSVYFVSFYTSAWK